MKNFDADQYERTFVEAYSKLNLEQKLAVDTLDGPVMVIAGPGTGKTQILAMRVGQILRETDTKPYNILCLTFTDAGAIAMRRRLIQMIGPMAHQVNICTFHAFCNQVIQENLGRFNQFRELDVLSDLEKVALYDHLIEELPNEHILKRLKSDNSFLARHLSQLFEVMKRENISMGEFESEIDMYISKRLANKDDTELYYQKNYKDNAKGDLKEHNWQKLERRMAELRCGVQLYGRYQDILKEMNRFEYTDMILWVLREFIKDESFLLEYQERYQYFLVDEFQDTNGAQNDLLQCLIAYWGDEANVFVVGDADQAIYRFQGANVQNIIDFKTRYKPTVIELTQNYRSTQHVLDTAYTLITHNVERLSNTALVAHSPHAQLDIPVHLMRFENSSQEEAFYAQYLEQEWHAKKDISHVAIIYRRHAQVDDLLEVLEKKNIPVNVINRIDILKLPLVKNICNILQYIGLENRNNAAANRLLFEIMHYNFFNIHSADIAALNSYISQKRYEDLSFEIDLLQAIGEAEILKNALVNNPSALIAFAEIIQKWISDAYNMTLQMLFQHMINEGGILKKVMESPEKTWQLQILTTLFDLIKKESEKDASFSIHSYNRTIQQMIDNGISLPVTKVVSNSKGAHFITAHSSKGLEFETVMILGNVQNNWAKRTNRGFKYPDSINRNSDSTDDDERRLMYVAITRAKKELIMSFGDRNKDGKDQSPCMFIDEIVNAPTIVQTNQTVQKEALDEYQFYRLFLQSKSPKLIDHSLIDRVLSNFTLSVTALNKYLNCPVTFYFDTILRVPSARSKHMGYGRAVHYAFEKYFEQNKHSYEELITYFDKGMKDHESHFTPKEFMDMRAFGHQCLKAYFDQRLSQEIHASQHWIEHKIDHVTYEGIPLKGLLDRVDIYPDHVEVWDYKTGNYSTNMPKLKAPKKADDLGGDYWRQMVFYDILLANDPRTTKSMATGYVDFIEPDKESGEVMRTEIKITEQDRKIVGQQIKDAWQGIHEHKFEKGCGDPNCQWCNFVKNEYVFDNTLDIAEDVEMWLPPIEETPNATS